jgi:hypothetical protein
MKPRQLRGCNIMGCFNHPSSYLGAISNVRTEVRIIRQGWIAACGPSRSSRIKVLVARRTAFLRYHQWPSLITPEMRMQVHNETRYAAGCEWADLSNGFMKPLFYLGGSVTDIVRLDFDREYYSGTSLTADHQIDPTSIAVIGFSEAPLITRLEFHQQEIAEPLFPSAVSKDGQGTGIFGQCLDRPRHGRRNGNARMYVITLCTQLAVHKNSGVGDRILSISRGDTCWRFTEPLFEVMTKDHGRSTLDTPSPLPRYRARNTGAAES